MGERQFEGKTFFVFFWRQSADNPMILRPAGRTAQRLEAPWFHPHPLPGTSQIAILRGVNQRLMRIAVAALVAITVAAHLPALQNGFIWDDEDHLTQNPAMTAPDGLRRIWTSLAVSRYYPLTLTTFWAQHRVWGLNPQPYHAVNIALHALNAALLFVLLRRLNVRGAWVGAALWAVHPVAVESVAWITELKNVQSGTFYFLTLLCFLRFERDSNRRWFVLSLVCFAAALLSKPSVVILPVVLLLVAWWNRGRVERRDWLRSIPFFCLSAGMSVLTIVEQRGHIGRGVQDWSLAGLERLVVAGNALWFYAGKLLWPVPLTFVYPRWDIDAGNLLSFLPFVAVVAAAFVLWRQRAKPVARALAFGLGYFVLALLPVLGFFDIYYFRYAFVGDHFQYLASTGALALLAAGGSTLLTSKPLRIGATCIMLIVVMALTWRHAHVFRDDETLWRDTISKNPQAYLALDALGGILLGRGQHEDAAALFQRALRAKPDYIESKSNLGVAFINLGLYDEAIRELRSGLLMQPSHFDLLLNLGLALAQTGDYEAALTSLERALQQRPDSAPAHNNIGLVLTQLGRVRPAIVHYNEAVRLKPDYAEAHANLAIALAQLGDLKAAIAQVQRALALAQTQGRDDLTDPIRTLLRRYRAELH